MPVKQIASLQEIAPEFDTFFVDMYGVIWDGTDVYPGVKETFSALRAAGKKIIILSNATTVSPHFMDKMTDKGFLRGVHYDDFITSGDLLAAKIAKGYFEKLTGKKKYTFYIIGRNNPLLFFDVFERQIYDLAKADLIYISSLSVNGIVPLNLDRFLPELEAALALKKLAVCANPDLFAFKGEIKHCTGGSAAEWYENHGGRTEMIGKPYVEIYEYAVRRSKTTMEKSIMIGDALRTDILGANRAGMESVLVTGTGVTADALKTGRTLESEYEENGAIPTFSINKVG